MRSHPVSSNPARPRRRRRGTFAPLAIAAAVALVISNAGIVAAWSNLTFSSTDEAYMVTLTNQARASAGLKSLITDSTLTSIARTRAKYIYDNNWPYHCSYPNTSCTTKMYVSLLQSHGYCYKVAGENLGENNYPDDQTTLWQFNWFMGSSTHKANILGSTYDHIGIGAYKGSGASGSLINHVFVMVFAQKCTTSPTPTPKPSPTPTPRPTATPKATPKPTPKPTPRPTATPRPTPTPTPGSQATPTPEATPVVTPEPTPTPDQLDPAELLGSQAFKVGMKGYTSNLPPDQPAPPPSAIPEPTAEPSPTGSTGDSTDPLGLQVVDPVPDQSLLDAIVGGVLSSYLGQ
jgi:uncharacterized protein YkwD